MNEIRNELLLILQINKESDEDNKKIRTEWLLERFEDDIKTQLKDLEYKKQELENNLKVLEYVKKELGME